MVETGVQSASRAKLGTQSVVSISLKESKSQAVMPT